MVLGMEINAASDFQIVKTTFPTTTSHPLIDNASSFGLGYAVTYTQHHVVYPTIHTLQFVINLATIQLGLVPLKPH